MKSFLKIAVGVFALSFAQQSSATSTFRLTGSTAFRAGLYDTIVAAMGGTPASNIATCKITTTAAAPGTITAANGRAAVNAANVVTFVGVISGINGNAPITVQCAMSGSATGLITCFNSTPLSYAPATAGTAGYDNVSYSAAASDSGAAPFAMSDIYQNSVTTTAVSGLTDTQVAVVPFCFVANRGTTGLTNITAQNARVLFNNGTVPLSVLTGDPTKTNNVYMTGRDNGSGTRVTVLAETKFGIANLVQQYFGVTSGTAASGTGTITSLQLWPTSGTATFDPLNAGNGGYGSGGTIATLMGFLGTSVNILNASGGTDIAGDTSVVVVGYLGAGDTNTAVNTNGAVRLSYDGYTYTSDTTGANLVYNGGYSLWCYEHLNHKGTLTSGTDDFKFNAALKTNFTPNLGVNGVDINQMAVSRTGDGALVGP